MIAVKEAILCPAQGSTVALGYFDGVHIGHREVISAAVRAGKAEGLIPSVFTFCGELPVKEGATLLQTRAQRRRALEALGVEFTVCPDFEKIRDMEPAHFFQEILRDRLRARVLVCGFNYRFGAGGAGDIALLRTLCEGAGIRLIALPPVEWGGEPISSTRIRGALREGRPEEAAAMLHLLSGREHQVMTGCTVLRGDRAETFTEVTELTFRELTDGEIREYVASGEPMDKAGAYGIQGGAARFCPGIRGDYYNVMGLPVCRLGQALKKILPETLEENHP